MDFANKVVNTFDTKRRTFNLYSE